MYFALVFGLRLLVTDALTQNTGEVVLYSEKNFQGFSYAYPIVGSSCVGRGGGFPSVLNKSVGSLKTDHLIAVYPLQYCEDGVSVKLGPGSYPDLTELLRNQQPEFETVMKSFYMFPFQEDNVEIFSRQGPQGQNATLLLKLLVADIDHSTPCFKFDDTMSKNIGGVNNHLNCLVFFTGKECKGRNFKVDAQESQVSFKEYQPSQTYYGMTLCGKGNETGKDIGKMKAGHVAITLVKNDPYYNPKSDHGFKKD